MDRLLGSLGGQVKTVDEVFTASSHLLDDLIDYGLFVVDCDTATLGGLAESKRILGIMGDPVGRVPVILVPQDCVDQHFPEDRMAVDLPPCRPSFITRVWLVASCRFGFGQVRLMRSPQIVQARDALLPEFCCRAGNRPEASGSTAIPPKVRGCTGRIFSARCMIRF